MKFSIVIPTRNRADKLRHALRSALAQRFRDFEIVVSNNNSSDNTAEVVAEHSHRRLRSVRPSESLSMVAHWEFALSQAQGDWVLFLCDDDALVPQALSELDTLIQMHRDVEVIQYGSLTYIFDDGVRQGEGNSLVVGDSLPWFARRVNSRRRLEENFFRLGGTMPKFLNSVAKRELIDRIRQRHGRMFLNWAPDYSSAVLLLSHTKEFLESGPLMLSGENMQSYGAGSAHKPSHMLEFFKQFPEFRGTLENSPYPEMLTICNTVYDTFIAARKSLGNPAHLRVSEGIFRRTLIKDMQRYVARGHEEFVPRVKQVQRDLLKIRTTRLLRPSTARLAIADGMEYVRQKLDRYADRHNRPAKVTEPPRFATIFDAAQHAGRLLDAREMPVTRRAA